MSVIHSTSQRSAATSPYGHEQIQRLEHERELAKDAAANEAPVWRCAHCHENEAPVPGGLCTECDPEQAREPVV